MAQLNPYLSFNGDCREALHFYQSCLGGQLTLQAFGESPAADYVPAALHAHILHGRLDTEHFVLMASDAGGTPYEPGHSVSLCLQCVSDNEIETLFARLGEGGTVCDPLADMFWGGRFGSLNDRFGIKWLFNFDKPSSAKP